MLRRRFRALRNSLQPTIQQANARAIANHLTRSFGLLRARTVAGYIAADGEVDLSSVFEELWRMNKTATLPVINPLSERLDFYRHAADRPLVRGRFDIPVPEVCAGYVPLLRIDLMLTPLVAFDAHGTRLGMGGGYYDRTLQSKPRRLRPFLLGVAHSCQQSTDVLPRQSWDIPLDGIVTELGISYFHQPQFRTIPEPLQLKQNVPG